MPDPLRTEFLAHFEEWKTYCEKPEVQFSSRAYESVRCDAYRKIVDLGPGILPLIKEAYDRGDDASITHMGMPHLIRELVGPEFAIPEEIAGDVEAIRMFTHNWLNISY